MQDIADLIKNLETLTVDNSSFQTIKDFERVLDELDIYAFLNWENGELLAGPKVNRYTVSCKFMWPKDKMPDPDGGARLLDYGCKITYQKTYMLVPRKVTKPSDFRPGTKKGKIDPHPIWVIEITMPKKLMKDIYQGKFAKENMVISDMMRYDTSDAVTPNSVPQEVNNLENMPQDNI
jgi:hypothetical protein